MTDKNNKIDDEDIIKAVSRRKYHEKDVIVTYTAGEKSKSKSDSSDRDPKQILLDLEDLENKLDERNENIVKEILDGISDEDVVEIIKGDYVTPKKNKDLEESNQSEFSELVESFVEARFEGEGNIIRNVCLLSSISKNNRKYLDEAMEDIVALADGVKVFADHEIADGKGKVRSVRDLIGKILHPHKVNEKIYGNFEVLENHKDWIFAIAKQMPENIGMSIVAKGKMHPERDSEGREQVESVKSLTSIDLVTSPATTSGLYESK